MTLRTAVLLALLALLLAAPAVRAGEAPPPPPDSRPVEEMTGELTTEQSLANVISFPFRMVGYLIYYPLKFLFYDIWAWLFDALFGSDEPSVSDLVERLSDADAAVRRAAVRALGRRGDEDALPALLGLFADADEEVRSEAVRAVGRIGSDRASSRLMAMAQKAPSWRTRDAAMRALGLLRERAAVWLLLKALDDPRPALRYSAAMALGSVGDVAAGPALSERLRDGSFRVRAAAALALGRIGDPEALPALREAWERRKEEGSVVRASLVQALGRLGGEAEGRLIHAFLLSDLAASDPFTRGAAAHVLGEMGRAEAAEDLEKLLFSSRENAVIGGAALGLACLGRTAPLSRALASDNPYRRIAAIVGLRRADAEEAAPLLLRAAEDPYSDVRRYALLALVTLGRREAVPLIIGQLAVPDLAMRAWALELLQRLSGRDFGLDAAAWGRWWEEEGGELDWEGVAPPEERRRKLSGRRREASRRVWARYRRWGLHSRQ